MAKKTEKWTEYTHEMKKRNDANFRLLSKLTADLQRIETKCDKKTKKIRKQMDKIQFEGMYTHPDSHRFVEKKDGTVTLFVREEVNK